MWPTALSWLALSLGWIACTGEVTSAPTHDLPELPPLASELEVERGPERPERQLTLVLSGELRGEIEPCGCPTLPYGGFARRGALLEQLRAEGKPLIQVDAGEALLKGLVAERSFTEPRALLIAGLLQDMGLDAFVPGPTDHAALGVQGLRDSGLPLVSATWLDDAGAPLFAPYAVVEKEGLKVGIIGLSSPVEGVPSRDAVDAVQAVIPTMPGDLDLLLAVGNLRDEDALRVAQVPGLALVVNTPGERRDALRTQGGAPVIEVSARGRYLGVVRAALGSEAGRPLELEEDRALEEWMRLQGRAARMPELAAEVEGAAAKVDTRGRNRAWLEDRPLGSDLEPGAPGAVDQELAAFKESTLATAQERVESQPDSGPHYATGARCVSCHSYQVAAWAARPNHARAMEVLFERGESENPECVQCHSTGFGEPGGFAQVDRKTLQTWGNVQCEACHGPLGGHPRDASVSPTPVSEQTCLGCHDPANSPEFDYEAYRTAILCPADPG